jgi:uncharacterized protein (UPF0333 family)
MPDDTKMTITAFGKTLSVEGVFGILIVVLLAFSGALVFLLYDLSTASSNAATAASKAVSAAAEIQKETVVEHKAIMATLERIQGEQTELDNSVKKVDSSVKTQNYILLSEPDEKAKIKRKMQMPKELREMMSDR